MTATRHRGIVLALLFSPLAPAALLAHGDDPRYHPELPFRTEQITRTLALGRTLGLRGRPESKGVEVAGRPCVAASVLGFDVADDFAFDLDERVDLALEIDAATSPPSFLVAYDRSGSADSQQEVKLPEGATGVVRVDVELERARFAGRGSFGTDLAIAVPEYFGTLTLCGLELRRSGATPAAAGEGEIEIRLVEEGGGPTAARVGLYDATGRSPLPSEAAVPVRHFYEEVRMVTVRHGSLWPAANRWVFYVDGSYRARVPAGTYQVVAAKGLEHRIARRTVVVEPERTTTVDLTLSRWRDQPAAGWYSGDPHVHIGRELRDNPRILAQMAAEDLHVANLLRIGNVATTWFEQPGWGEAGRYRVGDHVLVSGQEDPTTGHRGHTIGLNLSQPIRDLDRYFLYHDFFAAVGRQGGLAGYAHLSAGWFHVERGLALDVPHDLVDFVEVLQIGLCDTATWYPFLDLGFRLVPTAGSDYPYIALPGTVRNYVKVDGEFTPQGWFDGLAAGRTFVTNGPLLELAVNGHGMGETLAVERGTELRVAASASINPDLDRLTKLELVVHGDVVATTESAAGAETLTLEHRLTADESLWLAVRAFGAFQEEWNTVTAHSAPVYVTVDGGRWWDRDEVAAIVAQQREYLEALRSAPLDPAEDLMFWDTSAATVERWRLQRSLVEARIRATEAIYDALLEELGTGVKEPAADR